MYFPMEEGTKVISLPRVTNIPRPSTALTITLEADETEIPEVSQVDHAIEA